MLPAWTQRGSSERGNATGIDPEVLQDLTLKCCSAPGGKAAVHNADAFNDLTDQVIAVLAWRWRLSRGCCVVAAPDSA